MRDATFFNTMIGIGSIIISVAIIGSIIGILIYPEITKKVLKKYFLWDGFLLALAGVIGSLTYSEFFQFLPCTLCWWQRIFLYPQLVLFSIGLWGHGDKRTIAMSSIVLSSFGILVSIYQYTLQMGAFAGSETCIGGISCTSIDAIAFGFITIPMMCGILFLGILVTSVISLKKS